MWAQSLGVCSKTHTNTPGSQRRKLCIFSRPCEMFQFRPHVKEKWTFSKARTDVEHPGLPVRLSSVCWDVSCSVVNHHHLCEHPDVVPSPPHITRKASHIITCFSLYVSMNDGRLSGSVRAHLDRDHILYSFCIYLPTLEEEEEEEEIMYVAYQNTYPPLVSTTGNDDW